jgi:hypothetical protein
MLERSMMSTGDELPKSEGREMRVPVTTTVWVDSSSVCCANVGTDRIDASVPPTMGSTDFLFISDLP